MRGTGAGRRLRTVAVDTDPRDPPGLERPRIDIGLSPVGIWFRHEVRSVRRKHDHAAVATHCRLAGPSAWRCIAGDDERPHCSILAVSKDDASSRGAARREIRCDGLEDDDASVYAEGRGLAVALRRRAVGADALLR